jgi:lycopene cyclase CruA
MSDWQGGAPDRDRLRARFPRTVEALAALPSGDETLAHLQSLERRFVRRAPLAAATGGPDLGARPDFDVALAGGGLSLIYAAYLARLGLRVVVFDRRRIGCGHREWNISRRELAPLAASGLFTVAEVEQLIALSYREGVVRWHGGGSYPVRGVLDCVIDAEQLLDGLRARAAGAGAALLDYHALGGYRVGAGGVALELVRGDGTRTGASARVLVDGMGAESPHAAFDLCCPTVGGVLTGLEEGGALDQVDPGLGEILVTTEDVEDGRQHIWEGFPGRSGHFTTYLFHYVEPSELHEHPLFGLYERFFATLPRYKRGQAQVEKATYGIIPAYTRLGPMPAARDRVLLVGDAAARHSPLTFCGFGSMIRSFLPVCDGLRARLEDDRLDRRSLAGIWREPAGLQVMGGLTLMMARARSRPPGDINQLLDAAFASLAELGNEIYAAFVRDEIGFRDFAAFMRRTARRRPTIYDEVMAQLSPAELAKWSWRFVRLGLSQWSSAG